MISIFYSSSTIGMDDHGVQHPSSLFMCLDQQQKKGSSSHSDKERSQQHNNNAILPPPSTPHSLALTTSYGLYICQKRKRKQQPYLLRISILTISLSVSNETQLGIVANEKAGPAVVISFIIASIVAGLAALSYAEMACLVPIAGSAYTYTYATCGELLAWIIGWDL
jgi:hypothetical protein